MKTLPEKIKDIVSRQAIAYDAKTGIHTVYNVEKELLAAFREYVEEVIGEDERSAAINGVPAQDMIDDYRNQLRGEQRKRLSLLSGLTPEGGLSEEKE